MESLSNLSVKGLLDPLKNPAPPEDSSLPERQRQKRLKPEEIERVVELYRRGATVYELAEQFSCHRTTISAALHKANVNFRRTGMTTAQIDEAAVLYESGLSLARVGERFNVNARTVQLRLRERGVAMRDTHGRRR
jgi:hypothetical protein